MAMAEMATKSAQTLAILNAIRNKLSLVDLIFDVRDARIPITSANPDLCEIIREKKRVVIVNKADLADPQLEERWKKHFEHQEVPCYFINAHLHLMKSNILLQQLEVQNLDSKTRTGRMVHKSLLYHVEDVITKKNPIVIMAVGIPNVGKSTLVNTLHRIGRRRYFPEEKTSRADTGPEPYVTKDIKGYKIGHNPSIFIMDTPGLLPCSSFDNNSRTKLALTGAVVDNTLDEVFLARYLLSQFNYSSIAVQLKEFDNRHVKRFRVPEITLRSYYEQLRDFGSLSKWGQLKKSCYLEEPADNMNGDKQDKLAADVRRALHKECIRPGNILSIEDGNEDLLSKQFDALQEVLNITSDSKEVVEKEVARILLELYRDGRICHCTLDTPT